MITNDLPLDTKILLFALSYSQKIFFGYSIIQFPVSILPFIFCSKSKFKFKFAETKTSSDELDNKLKILTKKIK